MVVADVDVDAVPLELVLWVRDLSLEATEAGARFFGVGIAPGWGPFLGLALISGFLPSNKWFMATGAPFRRVPPFSGAVGCRVRAARANFFIVL